MTIVISILLTRERYALDVASEPVLPRGRELDDDQSGGTKWRTKWESREGIFCTANVGGTERAGVHAVGIICGQLFERALVCDRSITCAIFPRR